MDQGPHKPRLMSRSVKWPEVLAIDLVVMLFNVLKASQDEQVGFEDANNTLESLIRKLNAGIRLDPSLIESCLWSCNLLSEKDSFWHPKGVTFDQFVARALPQYNFNKIYNTIEKKE